MALTKRKPDKLRANTRSHAVGANRKLIKVGRTIYKAKGHERHRHAITHGEVKSFIVDGIAKAAAFGHDKGVVGRQGHLSARLRVKNAGVVVNGHDRVKLVRSSHSYDQRRHLPWCI